MDKNLNNKLGRYKLYYLIDMYLCKKINEFKFCSKYCPFYNLELDKEILTKKEYKAFSELFGVAGRLDESETGSGFLYTKEELRQKIIETKESLRIPLNRNGKMDKHRIYYLMDMYLTGNIDGSTFCNEFCRVFDHELDFNTLTEEENRILSDLALVVYGFSEIESGRIIDFDNSYKEDNLRKKILETLEKLEVAPE
ncbi:MAG: hypothetical protein ACRCSV_05235 [Chlamydiales bacterium]